MLETAFDDETLRLYVTLKFFPAMCMVVTSSRHQ